MRFTKAGKPWLRRYNSDRQRQDEEGEPEGTRPFRMRPSGLTPGQAPRQAIDANLRAADWVVQDREEVNLVLGAALRSRVRLGAGSRSRCEAAQASRPPALKPRGELPLCHQPSSHTSRLANGRTVS